MIENIRIEEDCQMVGLASCIVYQQKPYWCGCSHRQLRMSLMKPRQYTIYDKKISYPVIVFICGGAFKRMDWNVWMPEMTYFAKRGYAVAGVEYSVLPDTTFPEPLLEVKSAIRFLRKHADELGIQKDKIGIMGESAGGYLACMTGATNGDKQYEEGENLEESSQVQAVAAWYPVVHAKAIHTEASRNERMVERPDISKIVTKDAPPYYLMHGLEDEQVPYSQSVQLYEKLQRLGVECNLTLVEGAHHGDEKFTSEILKEKLVKFFDAYL